jgi:hypothetical protein
MNIKSDIAAYRKGDRAAEMRLAAFVRQCESRQDAAGLDILVDAGGRVGDLARRATTIVQVALDGNKKTSAVKRKLRDYLAQIDRLGFNTDVAKEDRRWVPLLREAAQLRWSIKPDQEMYNIDLEIRNKIRRAAQLGVKI